jgi:[acyl-carrier-protein] S-malonyltransferase
MARDLIEHDAWAAKFLEESEAQLHVPLRRLMLDGPEESLQRTEHAQPAILFQCLALLRRLQDGGVDPVAVAGHSLGEFAGLVAAGGLDAAPAMLAVRARGQAMAAAARDGSGMAAVIGLSDEEVARVLAGQAGADIVVAANYNAPGQLVISGTDLGIRAVSPALEAAGAKRIVRLGVSAAFHSPLMAEAATVFRRAWEEIPLRRLRRAQVFNADADVHREPEDVRELMVRQLTGPVRWTASVHRLWGLGVRTFVEVGPRRTLTALVRKIQPQAVIHNVEDLVSLRAFLEVARA